MQINIAGLVSAAQSGDERALSRIFSVTYKDLHYISLKITGDEAAASEVLEESYKKILSSIQTVKNPENFEKWARITVAVNSVEALKKSKGFDFALSGTPSQKIEDNAEFLPKGIEGSANAVKAVNKIVDALPDAQRAALVLYYFSGVPIAQIASALGCSPENAENALYCARENVKSCVDKIIKKETEVYAVGEKPLLGMIMQASAGAAVADENTMKSIFESAMKKEAAANTAESEKAKEEEQISSAYVDSPVQSGVPSQVEIRASQTPAAPVKPVQKTAQPATKPAKAQEKSGKNSKKKSSQCAQCLQCC